MTQKYFICFKIFFIICFFGILGNRNSAEVKRATVVGNPMFSANDTNGENKSATDLAALDDLQLDMDYDQIMHYFDNLKV